MAETLNMIPVSLKRAVSQIKMQLENDDYTPFIMIGKAGIGKTETIMGIAKEMGIGFKELRLSHYQESDLVGLPYIDNGVTKHAQTDLLPDTNDTGKGILLLDEITSSQKSMRSAVYQLMDSSRKLGQYKLPEKWLVVGCGNGPDDGGDFRGIEAALVSRSKCVRIEPSIKDWKVWAVSHGIHPIVIAYLSFDSSRLHVMDLDRPNDMIACPRNWAKLSTQLINMEKQAGGVIKDLDDLEFAACCCVGASNGPGFTAFYQYNSNVIDIESVIAGTADPKMVQSLPQEVVYITVQNIVQEIRKMVEGRRDRLVEEDITRIGNICNWIARAGDYKLDFAVMAFQELGGTVPDFMMLMLEDPRMNIYAKEVLDFGQKNKIIYSA